MLREDRNGDGRFKDSEMPAPYVVELKGPGAAVRLLERSTEESMDALLR